MCNHQNTCTKVLYNPPSLFCSFVSVLISGCALSAPDFWEMAVGKARSLCACACTRSHPPPGLQVLWISGHRSMNSINSCACTTMQHWDRISRCGISHLQLEGAVVSGSLVYGALKCPWRMWRATLSRARYQHLLFADSKTSMPALEDTAYLKNMKCNDIRINKTIHCISKPNSSFHTLKRLCMG